MALAGKAMGVIDTIANLQLVKLYQKDSAIFLQVRGGRGGKITALTVCVCLCLCVYVCTVYGMHLNQ